MIQSGIEGWLGSLFRRTGDALTPKIINMPEVNVCHNQTQMAGRIRFLTGLGLEEFKH
jgi:hypothetical protein